MYTHEKQKTDLKRSARAGLSDAEVEASRKEHGENVLPRMKQKSFLAKFFTNLGDPVIRILLLALLVNVLFLLLGIGSGDTLESVGIAVSVLLATLISTFSDHNGDSAYRRLSEESSETRARVRRSGTVREIPLSEIVVGDILLLSQGDLVPADGKILSGRVGCDQSALTGESKESVKYPCATEQENGAAPNDPASRTSLFRGSTVLTGECEMHVSRVGRETFLGEISREVQKETRDSPLKLRLGKLAKQISIFGYIAAAIIAFAYLFITFFVESGFEPSVMRMRLLDLPFVVDSLLHALTLGLTVIVVAVPEGLPLMVAVVLSSNMKRMVKDRVLVRKPAGIEAAGSMNLLFTDKTGTLTEGRLSVGEILLADGASYPSLAKLPSGTEVYRHYVLSATENSSSLTGTASACEKKGSIAIGGNGTDRALLSSVLQAGVSPPLRSRTFFLPFDSTRKFSAAVVREGGRAVTLLKGAPEKILPFVSHVYTKEGATLPFERVRNSFTADLKARTEKGLRVIVLAVAEEELPAYKLESGHFSSLTLVCAVALCDKIRPEAPKAVAELREAGVHVVMITGDNRDTAAAIAEKCGILKNGVDTVISGEELSHLSDTRVKELLPRLGVVARALPSDKSRLVALAQEEGLVVGMTGDGINDAPALKRADVGFSMGSGTAVAKDAGDVIILDDNLASIVRAVLYGRTIFRSIRKFITLQLTMNFSAVGVTMLCPFFGIESPVTVVQMLWINLIMDTLGGLAFAGEAPMRFYMKEQPKKRDEPILNRYMIHEITLLGGFTVALSLVFLFSPAVRAHYRQTPNDLCLLTAFFAFFIFSSVANCFNCRSDRLSLFAGIAKNRLFLLIIGFVLAVQLVFVYLGGSVLRTMPLTPEELLYTLLLSLLVFPFEFLRKLFWRLSGHRRGY